MSKRFTLEEAQARIDKKHGLGIITIVPESYIYVQSIAEFSCYVDDHKNWKTSPSNVYNTSGCPACWAEKKRTLHITPVDQVQPKIDLKHGIGNITLVSESYKKISTNAFFKCKNPNHKDWENKPNNILMGQGCPACANYGFDINKPAIIYYFQDIITGEYKLGKSNRSLFYRFDTLAYKKRIRLIKVWNFDSGLEASNFEKEVHKSYNFYRTDNISWRNIDPRSSNGSTEFFFDDILNLDNNPLPIFGLNTLDLKTKTT